MKKILLLSFMLLLTLSFNTLAQNRTVTGKVTSSTDGSGIPGVNVILKGTNKGAITDIDGNYRLTEVPSNGGTLQFSFIGLKPEEVVIGARSVVDVLMKEDVETLSEVVVTGYGVEQKRDLTGSISQVKGEVFENQAVTSLDRALQGRAAGVQVQAASGAPGAAITVRIRGQGSLQNNTPLYIVDGVQVNAGAVAGQGSNNALAAINPNDIESIEILKDAASAAIYGAQAANGVILVTTKRGKAGSTNIDITYQKGVVTPLELYDVMNAQQFAEIKAESYDNNPSFNRADALRIFGNSEDPSTLNNFSWVDAIFRESASQDIMNIRLSGGSEKTSFFISSSLETTQGQVIESGYNRQTFRMNITQQASEKLTVSATLGITRQNQQGSIANGNFVNGPFQSAFISQPNSPAFAADGSYNYYPLHNDPNGQASGVGHNFDYNIVQGVNEERRESYTASAIGSLNITYKILPSLTFNVLGGLDFVDSQSINERPATIPAFSGFGGATFVDNRRELNWNSNATLTFSKNIGEDHKVSAIVGIEGKEEFQERNTATGRGFANTSLRLLGAAATPFAVGGTLTSWTRAGVFGRANYSFQDKYILNATIRRDGSSRFGANNRFGTFWSVGASWRLIEESFLSGTSFLDDLKLRFSYGLLGNANGIGNFAAVPAVVGARQYVGGSGQSFQLANDLLGWESSAQANIGLDFALLKNRIYGSVEVFRNDTGDQLFSVPLAEDSGFQTITGNAGEVRNQGIEIEISTVNVDKGGFKWVTSGNLTIQENELTELPNGDERVGNTLIVGEPIAFFWGVDYAGVNPANGRALWTDVNGVTSYGNISPENGSVIGSPIPKYFGGLSNTFSYKGLSLDVFFQFQLEWDAFNGDLFNLANAGSDNGNQLVSQLDRWQNPGDITNVPQAFEGNFIDGFDQQSPGAGLTNGRWISDGSYVRLKQVSLSYEFPKAITEKLSLNRLSVFAQGTNLLTFSKFDGIDPEVIGNQNDVGGSSFGVFPVGRQVTGGITVGF